jgi:hypothetical protein
MTEPDLRPPQQQQRARSPQRGISPTQWLLIALAIASVGYGVWYAREYWAAQQRLQAPVAMEGVQAPLVEPPPPELVWDTPLAAPAESVSDQALHPVPLTEANTLAPDDGQGLDRLARDWLGQQALKFLVLPGLAHHVVATVDNLPRSHAAPRVWPLYPVGGQMQLSPHVQGMQIAEDNSARYDAVVAFVTGIAPAQAARWYRQAYPVLQQTYENLGYPGKHFNDRLVAVIDHLLQTPEPDAPLAVRLVQVQGQVAPQQPWLRYEFADPQLQALSAGQKILLRVGAQHRQHLKTYLQALRSQITA